MKLFIEGLATRDFEPSSRLLLGKQAPLSPSVISRLLQKFRADYAAFDRRDLSEYTFVYIWTDGIYLKAGLGTEKACLMVLIGADTEGRKHLIALREGYRESAESWGELIADSRKRGMNQPPPPRAAWISRRRGVRRVEPALRGGNHAPRPSTTTATRPDRSLTRLSE